MFAGFAGVYVAQLLVTGTALISLLAAALGSSSAGAPITLGVLALAAYTLGIIGGAICLQRPGVGAILMLVGAAGGAVATVAIGPATLGAFNGGATAAVPLAPSPSPSPTAASSSTSAVLAVPFAPPLLLLVAATLSFLSMRRATLEPSAISQPMRRRTVVLGIGAAALVVALALAAYALTQRAQSSAAASASATPAPTASPVPTPTPRPTATPDATIAPRKVGESIPYTNGWTVTVTKWQEQPPARFSTPAPGLRFVVVTVRLDNASAVNVQASQTYFKLQDSSGIRRSGEFFIDRNDLLATSNVAPGGFISGTIVFAAPVGDTKLTVIYEQPGYAQATWQLY
jgi:uncharacterized protein DUF4352